MSSIHLIWQSPLAKTLPGDRPQSEPSYRWQALRGERAAIQLALQWDWQPGQPSRADFILSLCGPLAAHLSVYAVETVPSRLPAYPWRDEHYLTDRPGLLPDRLRPLSRLAQKENSFAVPALAAQTTVLWLEWVVPETQKPGLEKLTVDLFDAEGTRQAKASQTLQILAASLPPQTLRHTEWFHADCLADYYRVPVFSKEHWQICEQFLQMAGDHGVNMLLTPLFTPPLDTAVGGERTTVQLIDVERRGQNWHFGFTKLERWLDMARRCGIRYFEMAHLFSQWGARYAPKIVAKVDGISQTVFGWHTPATSSDYPEFLARFLPRLVRKLRQLGVADHTYFHVSDEPQSTDLAAYRAARRLIEPYLDGFPIIDALSDFDLYQKGAVLRPIPASDRIQPFLKAKVPDLWTYYCCAQATGVSNRFMAMPSWRNRVLGVQLYLYRIQGFLHWGYNFYSSQHSRHPINPHETTDAAGAFPSGDPFLVYPGKQGRPWPSLRLKVFEQALADLRALQALEDLSSRTEVLALIQSVAGQTIRFDACPAGSQWLLDLREQVYAKIVAYLAPK